MNEYQPLKDFLGKLLTAVFFGFFISVIIYLSTKGFLGQVNETSLKEPVLKQLLSISFPITVKFCQQFMAFGLSTLSFIFFVSLLWGNSQHGEKTRLEQIWQPSVFLLAAAGIMGSWAGILGLTSLVLITILKPQPPIPKKPTVEPDFFQGSFEEEDMPQKEW